jgi:hypothetical protein
MKLSILRQCVSNDLLQDEIKKKLGFKQKSIDQSFRRSIAKGYLSGEAGNKEVVKIIAKHLKIKNKDLYDN